MKEFISQRKSYIHDTIILHHVKFPDQWKQEVFQDWDRAEHSWNAEVVGGRVVGGFYLIMNNTVEKNLNIKIEKEVVGAECGEKKKRKKKKAKERMFSFLCS